MLSDKEQIDPMNWHAALTPTEAREVVELEAVIREHAQALAGWRKDRRNIYLRAAQRIHRAKVKEAGE